MDEFKKVVAGFAAQAVAASQQRGKGTLDFSEGSLTIVEEILDQTSASIADMEPKQLTDFVVAFGSYILEVGRRLFGGRYCWYEQPNQPVLVVGEPHYRIAIITLDRVHSRLRGNREDNIPFFFDGFSSRVRNAKAGDDAFYV